MFEAELPSLFEALTHSKLSRIYLKLEDHFGRALGSGRLGLGSVQERGCDRWRVGVGLVVQAGRKVGVLESQVSIIRARRLEWALAK